MRSLVLTVAAAVLAVGSANAQDPASAAAFKDAFGVAAQAVPTALLVKARAEGGTGTSKKFGFYFYERGRVVEIEVRGKKVVKNTDKDNVPVSKDVLQLIQKKTNSKTKLPDGRLLEIVESTIKDSPLTQIAYENNGGQLLLQAGDVKIDAETGKVITK